jgi:amino acid transporter
MSASDTIELRQRSKSDYNVEHATKTDENHLQDQSGYAPEVNLLRNRSLYTLLFQSLAIAAVPYGEGSPLISAIYGGGQLSIFLGWIIVCILYQCVAMSIAEMASRYPSSSGPSYWSHQLAQSHKDIASYATGWSWLVGCASGTLSVNFGFASLVSACITLYHPEFTASSWQLLLIFYAITISTFVICCFLNRFLPHVDTFCAGFTTVTIFVCLIALSVKADVGRHSAADALGAYTTSLSGYGGFTWFTGLLPVAYTFSAVGMITSMAEETKDAEIKLPKAVSLAVPIAGIAGLFFILPICATLPPLQEIIDNESGGQALPYIFARVMGSPGGGVALTTLVLVIACFNSVSITVATSRTTWAFARDQALPGSKWLARVHPSLGVPIWSLALLTIVQLLLGIINTGSSSAFTAFAAVGVVAHSLAYAVPITISMMNRRSEVDKASWKLSPSVGWTVNIVALAWSIFQTVLFCMPTSLPVTATSMNYASVVLVGFGAISMAYYYSYAHAHYRGSPEVLR